MTKSEARLTYNAINFVLVAIRRKHKKMPPPIAIELAECANSLVEEHQLHGKIEVNPLQPYLKILKP